MQIPATGVGWDLKVAPDAHVKSPNDYKIVGTSVPRVDLPTKFTASFVYTQDVRVPGMLHGRVVRPATVNSKPASVDEDSVKHIPGIVKIVREGSFVGVVAQTEWAAIQAAKALKVTWTTPETKLPANSDEVYDYLLKTKSFAQRPVVNRGNPDAAISQAAKTYEATFRWPFQMHGMMAPSCAVADVQGNKATVYAPSQGPFDTRKRVADAAGRARGQGAGDLSRSLRLLRALGHRRRGRRCGGDVPRRGQAGARAMDARGRARLGAQRPGATAHRSRRRGRQRQRGRLGLPGPQLSLDRIGRPAADCFTAGRDQGRRTRRPERHRRRRRHVHLRESEDRGRGHSLGEARSHSAAHFAAARARRPGARVRQRIVHGRTRRGCQCRPAERSGCNTPRRTNAPSIA